METLMTSLILPEYLCTQDTTFRVGGVDHWNPFVTYDFEGNMCWYTNITMLMVLGPSLFQKSHLFTYVSVKNIYYQTPKIKNCDESNHQTYVKESIGQDSWWMVHDGWESIRFTQ